MSKKLEYSKFIDLNYTPSSSDLIAIYYVEPSEGLTLLDVASRVAAESSVGTWTELVNLPPRVYSLMGRVFDIQEDKNVIKIAYPLELWEPGNVPQLLSGIAGNIFGMKAVKSLKLLDIYIPFEYAKHYKGPKYGIDGIRNLFKIRKRPITATVPKPKIGFSSDEFSKIAYEIWSGGVDLVKDDENLASLKFNKFEERVKLVLKMREKVEEETGERRGYLVNITAETMNMIKRAKLVADYSGEYVMVDILTVGFAALQTIREICEDLGLAIHAHRAMHGAFTKKRDHGISMLVIAKLARLIGVDQIHTGTVVGKMDARKSEVVAINNFLRGEWYDLKRVFPVASGGLHPGIIPDVLNIVGLDTVIQVGGGVLGHPLGPRAGAKAVRDVIEAYVEGVPVEDKARYSVELREALRKWWLLRPK